MDDIINLISEVGFPIASALVGGYFLFLVMKFILNGVATSVESMQNTILALDNRIKTMNHELIKIDVLISSILGIKPDIERLARSQGKEDARKD